MSNKQIFNNYQAQCPYCGGSLDASHIYCPYCGVNLQDINKPYRDDESTIANAIDDINSARQRIENRETQYEATKKGARFGKIAKWIFILLGLNFAFLIIVGVIMGIAESVDAKKVEEYKQQLAAQDVSTKEFDVLEIDDLEFKNTEKRLSIGYVQETDDVLAIPFYDDFTNKSVFEGTVYIDKDGFDEFGSIYEDRSTIYFEDYSLHIEVENGYYDQTTDMLPAYNYGDFKVISRTNNILLGDLLFECYETEHGYAMIANPFESCYISIEIKDSYDDTVSFNDLKAVLRVDCDVSLK